MDVEPVTIAEGDGVSRLFVRVSRCTLSVTKGVDDNVTVVVRVTEGSDVSVNVSVMVEVNVEEKSAVGDVVGTALPVTDFDELACTDNDAEGDVDEGCVTLAESESVGLAEVDRLVDCESVTVVVWDKLGVREREFSIEAVEDCDFVREFISDTVIVLESLRAGDSEA